MSSKNLALYRLLASYNSYMWDIVRAYKESGMSANELITHLVENNVCLTSKTIIRYTELYDSLRRHGYSDDVIDKRTPQAWRNYFNKVKKEKG
jgi:hypothetical protein